MYQLCTTGVKAQRPFGVSPFSLPPGGDRGSQCELLAPPSLSLADYGHRRLPPREEKDRLSRRGPFRHLSHFRHEGAPAVAGLPAEESRQGAYHRRAVAPCGLSRRLEGRPVGREDGLGPPPESRISRLEGLGDLPGGPPFR